VGDDTSLGFKLTASITICLRNCIDN